MKIIGIIPARYGATRFPGKPLIKIGEKTMIERVYNQVKKASLISEIVVATDDERIYAEVQSFGGKVLMTSAQHLSGTDRCAEVMNKMKGYDIAINIQGDEPFIDPEQIDLLCSLFEDRDTEIATLVNKIKDTETLFNVNRPKVVIDDHENALYFSRQALPFQKEAKPETWLQKTDYYAHIGIYGFRAQVLDKITQLPPSKLEMSEGLEQLRWLENSFKIKTAISQHQNESIDTPEDLAVLKKKYKFNL